LASFARCEQQASDLLAARLTETDFRVRLEDRCRVWQMEFPTFARRERTIIAIALFSACRSKEERTDAEDATAALACLRELSPTELFAVLPADLGDSAAMIDHLRLVSIGLTGRSAVLWERLAETARNILDPDA
jgi:hypothetical protein